MGTMLMTTWDRKNLLQLEGLSHDELIELIDLAQTHLEVVKGKSPPLEILAGKIIANLFFEDSTRTRCSFAIAARRLGADVIDLTSVGSSVSKGESIVDTAQTVEAMGVDAIVMRAKPSGASHLVAKNVHVPVINAGDGRHEHPTQGLLDLMTMRQHLGEMANRTVVIVGDIANSRVARSNLQALTTIGAHVKLVGPPTLVSKSFESICDGPGTVEVGHDFDTSLEDADVVMMLRVQLERQVNGGIPEDYRSSYGLTSQRASKLKPETIVMHPGPMNRGIEIDSEVADDASRSVIRQQVTNGVAVRMAVLQTLISSS